MSAALEKLKSDLRLKHGMKLIDAENLKSSPGIGTGWSALDSFVASGGFPCGEISLVEAPEGVGATTLWLDAAAKLTANHSRVAWLNSSLSDREPFQLHPLTALQRGVDLQKLFLVEAGLFRGGSAAAGTSRQPSTGGAHLAPARASGRQRLWVLQELLNSKLFSLVGCDLGDVRIPLRECRSLLMQARRSGAAVVLFDRHETRLPSAARSIASLVLKFDKSGIEIVRAAHRPVPQHLQRRDRHVDFITGPHSRPALESHSYLLDPSFILANSCADRRD